jgi:LPXTG-site transpeptidase (sortase) family protein
MIFAPIMAYVAPGNVSDDGIAAVDPTINTAVSDENKLIITKLNIDVPVHFGISNDTKTVNNAMMHGVAHFMVPGANAYPGQVGNVVITGHSAGDIYSSNQYKFIFSGLERLADGDLIYVDYNKVRYTYRITGRKTVEPTDVAALKYDGDKKMLTLITCWPLGTSRYRLLIFAEQISPTTETNPVDQNQAPAQNSDAMPKNENTVLENVWNGITGN